MTLPNINVNSQDWAALRSFVQEELEKARNKLENIDGTVEDYNNIRGQILAFRYILALETKILRRNQQSSE